MKIGQKLALFDFKLSLVTSDYTLHENEVFVKDFISKCEQILQVLRFLRICSRLLKKPLSEHIIFFT